MVTAISEVVATPVDLFSNFRYLLMTKCWQDEPNLRPNFDDLKKELKEMENQHKVNSLFEGSYELNVLRFHLVICFNY